MAKLIKVILIAIFMVSAFGFGAAALAQDPNDEDDASTTVDVPEKIIADKEPESVLDEVLAKDLDINEPKLLPDSPFYFLKNWVRKIKVLLTFNEVKKAELEQKFSSEKLLELKKLAEKNASSNVVQKATEKYQQQIQKLKDAADKIKDKAGVNQEVNSFLEKFTNQQILHEKILKKLETQVPEAVAEKITETREQHLERFQQVMTKLEENKDRITEKIKNALQNGDESNLEILDKIQKKMPEEVKQKLESVKTEVREKMAGCKELWWFDNDNKECQQKKFCGAYMYFGLQTFGTKEECENNLPK